MKNTYKKMKKAGKTRFLFKKVFAGAVANTADIEFRYKPCFFCISIINLFFKLFNFICFNNANRAATKARTRHA